MYDLMIKNRYEHTNRIINNTVQWFNLWFYGNLKNIFFGTGILSEITP